MYCQQFDYVMNCNFLLTVFTFTDDENRYKFVKLLGHDKKFRIKMEVITYKKSLCRINVILVEVVFE